MANTKKKTIIYCEKKIKAVYDDIKKSAYFKDLDLSVIFCLAAAYGFKKNNYKKLINVHSGGLLRVEYIENNNEFKSLLDAIAISHTKSLEVLLDRNQVYEIAEAYANGGIRVLNQMVFDDRGADFDKEIEFEINKRLK